MMLVREFAPEDAERLSRLIVRNLRRVLIRDYSPEAIEALAPFFTPARLIDVARNQHVIVCVRGADPVGIASLDGDRVRNVFVDVDMHRQGIGRLLMAHLEAYARENNVTRIYLHAALSAQAFYRALGYETVERIERELDGVPIPDIKMEKDLSKAAQ
jgi:GNAT superfamily N-acetyltransferase